MAGDANNCARLPNLNYSKAQGLKMHSACTQCNILKSIEYYYYGHALLATSHGNTAVSVASCLLLSQKKRGFHKIPPVILGTGNGRANFMGAWHFVVLSAGKPHAHKIPPFRGGVVGFLEGGGVEVPILFLWAWGFLRLSDLLNRFLNQRSSPGRRSKSQYELARTERDCHRHRREGQPAGTGHNSPSAQSSVSPKTLIWI